MKRIALLTLVLAVLLPAGLALLAQERDPNEKLDDLIEELRAKLAEREKRAKAASPLAYELHIYDVRDLVQPIVDYPGFDPNLAPSGGFGFGFSDAEDVEPLPFFEGDAMVDLIRDIVFPESWDELASVDISYQNGVLLVRHTAGVHARIRDLLDRFRSRAASQITVNMRLLRVQDATLRSILGQSGGCVLGEAAAKRLEEAVRGGRAKIVRRGTLTCTNTQRVSLNDLGLVTYLQDYDVEIAQGASIPDPIVQSVREGFVGDVRPTLAGEGKLVVLEVRADVAHLIRPMGTVVTPCGEIELPHVEYLKLRTTVGLPVGSSAVIGGALSDGDDEALLLVVTPIAMRPGAK